MKRKIRTHITIPISVDEEIRKFGKTHKMQFSECVSYLCNKALGESPLEIALNENNKLLESIYSKELYIRDLIEQFYADMEIEESLNPKNNKALLIFKQKRFKDDFSD